MSDAELAARPCSLAPGLLRGRTVVISGAGSGIGRASAWVAARLGARVVLCGRSAEKLARVRTALAAHGLECEASALDIRERGAVDQFFADLFTRHGHVDVLINSAGGQFPQAALDFSEKGWRAVIDTNLHGTFNMMQSIARHWRTQCAAGKHRQHRRLRARAAPGGAHLRCARRHRGIQRVRRRRVGAAGHPRQLHRARRHGLRGLGGVRSRGCAALRAIKSAAPCRLALGDRRGGPVREPGRGGSSSPARPCT